MKKLMPLVLGTALAIGSAAVVSFAQDQPKQDEGGKKKKGKKKSTEEPKKDLR